MNLVSTDIARRDLVVQERRIMNCDDVFAVLTRGPFPTGSKDDFAVEAHLLSCPACQRLAEALRPTDEALRESNGSHESGALPGYWGEPLKAPGESAISVSQSAKHLRKLRVGARSGALADRSNALRLWQFTAAVSLGILLAAALRTLVAAHDGPEFGRSRWGAGKLTSNVHCLSTKSANEPAPLFEGLDASRLSPALSHDNFASTVARISFSEESGAINPAGTKGTERVAVCCTQCHHAGASLQLSSTAKIQLQRTCRECHVSMY